MPTRDSSSPAAFVLATTSSDDPTGTSASFTPPNGSVITVSIGCDSNRTPNTTPTITVSNTGFSINAEGWIQHVIRGISDASATEGVVAIYSAIVTASASGTITVSLADVYSNNSRTANIGQVAVDVWTSASTATGSGRLETLTTEEGSSTTNSITPTLDSSLGATCRIIAMAQDWNALGTPSSSSSANETTYDHASIASGLRVYLDSDSTAGSSVSVNFDANGAAAADWNWCAIGLLHSGAAAASLVPSRRAFLATLISQ